MDYKRTVLVGAFAAALWCAAGETVKAVTEIPPASRSPARFPRPMSDPRLTE